MGEPARAKITLRDETCILRKKRHTVICGQSIVEGYLRQGYDYDWHATDAARAREILRAPRADIVEGEGG